MRLIHWFVKQKVLATVFLVVFLSGFLNFIPAFQKQVYALPVEVTVDAPFTTNQVRKGIWESIRSSAVNAAQVALGNAMLVFGQQVAYNAAITLAEMDYGEPFFNQLSAGKLLDDARDKAIGEFLDTTFTTITAGTAFEEFDICNPKLDLMAQFILNIEKEVAPTEPNCTWSDLKKTYAGKDSFYRDENFLSNFGASFDIQEHDLGQLNTYMKEVEEKKAAAAEAEKARQTNSEQVKPDKATGQYATPNFLKEEQAKTDLIKTPYNSLQGAADPVSCLGTPDSFKTSLCLTGKVSLMTFTNTFVNRVSKRIYSGLVKKLGGNTLSLQHVVDWVKHYGQNEFGWWLDGNGTYGTASGGLLAAGSGFSDLATPTLLGGTGIDVVPRLSATDCPEDKEFDQCVITPDFGQAILQKLTVAEAIENGYLSEDLVFGFKAGIGNGIDSNSIQEPEMVEGIAYSSMLVLRKYRIIPVTWEIAAQYIAEYGETTYTLRQMIEAYNDENSPFYRLVDPDWLLKAPVTQCARTGYVDDVYDESCFAVAQTRNDLMSTGPRTPKCTNVQDGTGLESVAQEYDDLNGDDQCDPDEDKKIDCSRKNTCVDQESCILEDENGNCKEFGYCVAEKDVWNFPGATCREEYASCLNYQNTATGEETYYLRRTLSINDCSSDSALGCLGYCQKGLDGDWACDYDTTTGLAAKASDSLKLSAPVFLNSSVQTCSENEVGCQEFLRTVNDANLIANSDFDSIKQILSVADGLTDDVVSDAFGTCDAASGPDLAGKGCYADANCGSGSCSFWTSSQSTPLLYSVTYGGDDWMQLSPTAETDTYQVQYDVETGSSLSERQFDISFFALAPQNVCSSGERVNLACENDNYCQTGLCNKTNNSGSCDITLSAVADGKTLVSESFNLSADVQNYADITFAVPRDIDVTHFNVSLSSVVSSTCATLLDKVKVQEVEVGRDSGAYTKYASSPDILHLGGSRVSCDAESVGCKLYSPIAGDLSIPGIVRESDQCQAENVGCKSYKEVSTRDNFEGVYAKSENAYRTGKYCENDHTVSCVSSSDCGGNACLPAVSLVVEKGESCSAQEVGCEAFTNLDMGDSAEAVQYYSKIRPCVKPDDAICKPFFTWEGSLTTGFQLREYYLEEDAGAPKFVPGANPGEEIKVCNETVFASGDDPNCQQFYDEDNNVYYARFDRTISCTNECSPLRNSFDNEVYMAAPSESTSCRSTSNGCKEYKGNSGNNQRILLDVKPTLSESGADWVGDATSMVVTSEAISAQTQYGSLSSKNGSDANSYVYSPKIPGYQFTQGRSYTLNFWIKGEAATTDGLLIALESESGEAYDLSDINPSTVPPKVVPNNDEWNEYTLGPVVLDKTDTTKEDIQIVFDNISLSEGIYLSHIRLIENDSAYIIKGSAPTCKGEENCQTYNDGQGFRLNLKSFTRLCQEEYVGCEAVVNTANSNSPFAESFVKPYGADVSIAQNVNVVPEDTIEFFVNNSSAYCSANAQGCQELGLPQFNSSYELTTFVSKYIINDPDSYDTTLCQRSQEYCSPYIHSKGGSETLKDPQQRWCQYKKNPNGFGSGWYKYGTDTPCPVRSVGVDRITAAGQVCVKNGEVVNPATPCSYVGDPVCSALGATCEYWVGLCDGGQDRCTEFVDGETNQSYFQISDENFIDTTTCSEDGVDPKVGCVAFRDISQDTLDTNSRKYCTSTLETGVDYVRNASDGKDFYDAIREGESCTTDADCVSNADTCDSLTDQFRQYATDSCQQCSTDFYTCNTSGNDPCCGKSGICKNSDGTRTKVSCDTNSDCSGGATCEQSVVWCNANETIKVTRDRVCDQWLTCSETSVVRDQYGKATNVCMAREICDEGEGGLCSKLSYSIPGNITVDMDVDFPKRTRSQNSETVSHMTGYSLAGIKFDDDKIVQGSYSYADMFEYSTNSVGISVPNGDFEKKEGGHVTAPPIDWFVIQHSLSEESDPVNSSLMLVKHTIDPDRFTNRYLSITSLREADDSGVYTKFIDPSEFDADSGFITVSFKARLAGNITDITRYENDVLRVRLESSSNPDIYMHHDEEPFAINGIWNNYVVRLRNTGGDISAQPSLFLKFLVPKVNTTVEIDDVEINPVLATQELPTLGVTTYAQALVEGKNFTNIIGIDQNIENYDQYGTAINVGDDVFNAQDDPFTILGFTEDNKVSLGAPVSGSACATSDCHGRITVDFGAQILVDKEGDDLYIKEDGKKPDECYYVEIASTLSDSAFKRIIPSDSSQVCDHQVGAFGGNGMEGKIDIATVSDLSDGDAFRYVRIIDVSDPNGDHGGTSTSGTDITYIKALSTLANSEYLARSCRAYPTERAPFCDYTDVSSSVHYQGWEGYCVERHPTNPEWCINWWPIDVIAGSENVFSSGMQSLTPAPLYYCAETEQKELPTPFYDGTDNGRPRYVCVADDWVADPTCDYSFMNFETNASVDRDDCFDIEGNGDIAGLTPDIGCSNTDACMTTITPDVDANDANGHQIVCPKDTSITVTVSPLCEGNDDSTKVGHKCSTIAVVEKPKAKALSLISTEPGWDGGELGIPNNSNPDKWALGVHKKPQYFDDNSKIPYCDLIEKDVCMEDKRKVSCEELNFNNLYCEDSLSECVNKLEEYYDSIQLYQFRDDGGGADVCGNDNEGDNNKGCSDGGWFSGGSCSYRVNDNRGDTESCSEVDDWNDVSSFKSDTDCGFNQTGYNPYDPQGSSWENDEFYPLVCSKVIQVVDENGKGMPYSSRVVGGLSAELADATNVSGNGYDITSDTTVVPWTYAYSQACSPYGSIPYITDLTDIKECVGFGMELDSNGAPLTSCYVDRYTGDCRKKNSEIAGKCEWISRQLEIYSPYNANNSDIAAACSTTLQGGAAMSYGWENLSPILKYSLCSAASEYPGVQCFEDDDCGSNGKCVEVNTSELGNDAVESAVRRIQQLFATSKGVWEWKTASEIGNRRAIQQGYNTLAGQAERLYAGEYNLYTDLDTPITWQPPERECGVSGHDDLYFYCYVEPVVSQMSVNNQNSANISLGGDDKRIVLQYSLDIDPDQTPVNKISIDWGDGERIKDNYEGTMQLRDYSCKETIVVRDSIGDHEECSACSGDATLVNGTCRYVGYPRITITDAWGKQSEEKRFSGSIIVGP